ncbi:MAG: thiaminase II [Chloroflexi bacterium]|nr:thiaminase II [Chloroflexota bacterium]
MDFSETLRRRAAALWRETQSHPFVRGIGQGSLPLEKFRFYLGQDYLFLIEYSRVLALAAAKAPTLEDMGRVAGLLYSTLSVEMDLHRGFAQRFGVSPAELELTEPTPTTLAYTRHLLHVAYSQGFSAIAASLLPCQWGYGEIGQLLAQRGAPEGQPLYGEWIEMYASPEYAALVEWLRGVVDRLGAQAGRRERHEMGRAFLTSSRYEYLFWDAAWHRERWLP